jgi:hypothetical protein
MGVFLSGRFKEITMKKLATSVFVLAMIAAGTASAEIKIGKDNKQTVQASFGVIIANAAIGVGAKAKQNLASNQGNVEIKGKNTQMVDMGKGGIVANAAIGANTVAIQNLASNSSATE